MKKIEMHIENLVHFYLGHLTSAMTNMVTSTWLASDMILPTLQNVTIWRATRCGLPNITQNCSKMPKLTGKNWRFGDEKPNLVAPSNCMSLVLNERTRLMQLDGVELPDLAFHHQIFNFYLLILAFLSNFEQFLANHIW